MNSFLLISPYKGEALNQFFLAILRTVFETEAETLILTLAFDLTEEAQTRILPLVIENCPDYCLVKMANRIWKLFRDAVKSKN